MLPHGRSTQQSRLVLGDITNSLGRETRKRQCSSSLGVDISYQHKHQQEVQQKKREYRKKERTKCNAGRLGELILVSGTALLAVNQAWGEQDTYHHSGAADNDTHGSDLDLDMDLDSQGSSKKASSAPHHDRLSQGSHNSNNEQQKPFEKEGEYVHPSFSSTSTTSHSAPPSPSILPDNTNNSPHGYGFQLSESATALEPDTDPDEIRQLWETVNRRLRAIMPSTSYNSAKGAKPTPRLVIHWFPRYTSLRDIFGDDVCDSDLPKPLADDTTLHHVSISEVNTFIVAVRRSLPCFDTILELADVVQHTLFRNTAAPHILPSDDETASTVLTYNNTPVAIRLLGADPNIQDESQSLWRHPSRAGSQQFHHDSGDINDIGVKSAETLPLPAASAHVSFWLLIANANLHPSITEVISNATGTFHKRVTTPYLSVNYCVCEHCSHRTADVCDSVALISRAGEASLYNRYLLREEMAYVNGQFSIDTGDVVHYAVVLG